jgi:ribosomal small subunit protein bTHX
MGKGDKKTRRGKIVIGSYGVRRPRKKSKKIITATKLGINPKKAVEEEVIVPVAEQAAAPVEIIETPVTVEIPAEVPAPKKPARKPPAKKTTEKLEKAVKAGKETAKAGKETKKAGKEASKAKTPKTKKKPAEVTKDKEETTRE